MQSALITTDVEMAAYDAVHFDNFTKLRQVLQPHRVCASDVFVKEIYFSIGTYCIPDEYALSATIERRPRLARDGLLYCGHGIGPLGNTQDNEVAVRLQLVLRRANAQKFFEYVNANRRFVLQPG